MTERSWVLIPPGAGLFSSLSYQLCVLDQVPHAGGNTTEFPTKIFTYLCSLSQSRLNTKKYEKTICRVDYRL